MPIQPTPFLGRAAEIASISGLLGGGACRIVSIVGPGGVGRTRLAVEVASCRASSFRNGARYVDLASASTPEAVASAVALAVGAAEGVPPAPEDIGRHLRRLEMLRVLDNVEHLVGRAPPPRGARGARLGAVDPGDAARGAGACWGPRRRRRGACARRARRPRRGAAGRGVRAQPRCHAVRGPPRAGLSGECRRTRAAPGQRVGGAGTRRRHGRLPHRPVARNVTLARSRQLLPRV
jgi:hypothetical protein